MDKLGQWVAKRVEAVIDAFWQEHALHPEDLPLNTPPVYTAEDEREIDAAIARLCRDTDDRSDEGVQ